MRSCHLIAASFLASLVSVFSFVIPFCLFLIAQSDHPTRVASQGLEVMIYLTPILLIFAFIGYAIVFAVLKLPTKIFDFYQIFKIGLIVFVAWMLLVIMILIEDHVNQIDFSALKIGILMYFVMLPILALGCMSANFSYFLMGKKQYV